MKLELGQLIGTDTCSYCGVDDECLSLPEDEDEERQACRKCIESAFDAHWGEGEQR